MVLAWMIDAYAGTPFEERRTVLLIETERSARHLVLSWEGDLSAGPCTFELEGVVTARSLADQVVAACSPGAYQALEQSGHVFIRPVATTDPSLMDRTVAVAPGDRTLGAVAQELGTQLVGSPIDPIFFVSASPGWASTTVNVPEGRRTVRDLLLAMQVASTLTDDATPPRTDRHVVWSLRTSDTPSPRSEGRPWQALTVSVVDAGPTEEEASTFVNLANPMGTPSRLEQLEGFLENAKAEGFVDMVPLLEADIEKEKRAMEAATAPL